MRLDRRQDRQPREVARHHLVEAQTQLHAVPRAHRIGDDKDIPLAPHEPAIRRPADRPAATLLIPMKKSRREFGRSDTSVTTATPASLSRATASCTFTMVFSRTPAPALNTRSTVAG
jgi:hypothetical protein